MGSIQSFITEFDAAKKSTMQFERKITQENVVATFLKMAQGHQILSLEDFRWVLDQAAQLYNKMPNLIELSPKPDERYIFVGDMHGCFETIIRLFIGDQSAKIEPLGYPGFNSNTRKKNIYIFNGDLVDRGGSGYQIVSTLALFSLLDPTSCLINRGNHESEMFGASTAENSMGYKFMFEIRGKFPTADMQTAYAPQVARFFYSLPICVRIDKNILVVHGGVPVASQVVPVQHQGLYGDVSGQNGPIRPKNVQPYDLESLRVLSPTRQETAELQDQPQSKNLLWHHFLWSYDRRPYAADFMEYNGLRTIVCSHTATPYHFVTTFLRSDNGIENYGIQSVARGDDTFQKVKEYFDEHPNLAKLKYSMMEIFSSPTNQGAMYAAYIDSTDGPEGERLCHDPLHWNYHFLGDSQQFKFVNEKI